MVTKPVVENGTAPAAAVPLADDDRALRELAIKQAERIRTFKLHLIAFAIGVPVLATVWVLTEYFEEGTWPDRFADAPDVAGTWSPWVFWAVGIWALILGIHAFKTYSHRPPSEAEIERELERMRSRG